MRGHRLFALRMLLHVIADARPWCNPFPSATSKQSGRQSAAGLAVPQMPLKAFQTATMRDGSITKLWRLPPSPVPGCRAAAAPTHRRAARTGQLRRRPR